MDKQLSIAPTEMHKGSIIHDNYPEFSQVWLHQPYMVDVTRPQHFEMSIMYAHILNCICNVNIYRKNMCRNATTLVSHKMPQRHFTVIEVEQVSYHILVATVTFGWRPAACRTESGLSKNNQSAGLPPTRSMAGDIACNKVCSLAELTQNTEYTIIHYQYHISAVVRLYKDHTHAHTMHTHTTSLRPFV